MSIGVWLPENMSGVNQEENHCLHGASGPVIHFCCSCRFIQHTAQNGYIRPDPDNDSTPG